MTFGPPPSHSNGADGLPQRPDWDVLARYAAGESEPGEAARVRQWLEANPADRALVDALAEPLDDGLVSRVDVSDALAAVHRRIGERQAVVGAIRVSRRWRFAMAAAAAVVTVAAVLSLVSTYRRSLPPRHQLYARVYLTTVGQRDSVLLGDGSRVVLGPDSRLEVSPYMKQGARTVALYGDALFIVRHDAASPFRVSVGHALIEDIGTTFAVESDDRAVTRVSVLTGSVRLRGTTSEAVRDTGVTLAAGDRGTVDLTGTARAERHAPVADDAAWTSGRLAFRDAPMAQIGGELHRWYGVLVDVADSSLADRHVTTTFDNTEPVGDVLTKIGLALGARVERHGDTATFTMKRGSVPIR